MLNKCKVDGSGASYWCVVSGSTVWLNSGKVPFGTARELNLSDDAVCIGEYQQFPVMWVDADSIAHEYELTSLRECLSLPEELFFMLSKAVQLSHMLHGFRFCPQCGGRNHFNHNQLAMQCGDCRTLHYPRISSCIIVAVKNQEQILLAQHPRHRNGMYTVIAGFVEVGETLEQCVAREVKEETGINIKNVRYFSSQPWAFPSNLMIGFVAEYQSGELKPDYTELSDAAWFSRETLPQVPPKGTIARALIEDVLGHIEQGE
jgi:NAD+ diphosphatase